LHIKRSVAAKDGIKPLAGICIMVDQGHGGSDPGALGPLGQAFSEKIINLNTAMKLRLELEKLGADVVMTRTDDKNVTLQERLAASRRVKPDLFISIHGNSMGDNVDISKIDGFSVFYREKFAQPVSETVFNHTIKMLNRNSKGIHNKNLYVTRGTWAPSILIESGFVANPYEFEWLMNKAEQKRLSKTIADAVVQYFSINKDTE
jgi:N-acetylmuramoyl-L-alanine amidase